MAATPPLKPHAILIPLPYQGHIIPFINLAIKLASKGFTISFVHTEQVHYTLIKAHLDNNTEKEVDFFSEARKSGLDIRYGVISDGLPMEFDRVLNYDEFWETSMLRDFPARVDEFVGETIRREPNLATILIADTFFSWSAKIAEKNGIKNVSFFTQPALVFSIGYHWEILAKNGHIPCPDTLEEEITYLPGIESLNTRDLMHYLKKSAFETVVKKVSYLAFEKAKEADFVLHNVVYQMESNLIQDLNKNQPNYAIGPINSFVNLSKTTIAKSLWSESDCTTWLDSKPNNSVLYVSFGSLAQTNKDVIQEIAYGLLLSEINFIWVVREDIVSSIDAKVLPDGFEDEVKDKGLIIPWCDQMAILSNPAVGGFLTHCGWNSILESIWCGVPMICYPFIYDQPTNRKLVVDGLKIGISLFDGAIVERQEVAEKIKNLMSGKDSNGLRQEVEKVKKVLHDAVEKDGSLDRELNRFIKDLKESASN